MDLPLTWCSAFRNTMKTVICLFQEHVQCHNKDTSLEAKRSKRSVARNPALNSDRDGWTVWRTCVRRSENVKWSVLKSFLNTSLFTIWKKFKFRRFNLNFTRSYITDWKIVLIVAGAWDRSFLSCCFWSHTNELVLKWMLMTCMRSLMGDYHNPAVCLSSCMHLFRSRWDPFLPTPFSE